MINPNPNIEMRLRMQVIDVHRKSRKTEVTLLVIRLFLDLLGASRICVIIVFSISGIGIKVLVWIEEQAQAVPC